MALNLRPLKQTLKSTRYHLYTLWLFIFSDLKTILIPSTIFGMSNTWAASQFDNLPTGVLPVPPRNIHEVGVSMGRALIVFSWLLTNFLPFAINNQRSESAIAEDRLNKPWRPFPCGRISHEWGTRVMGMLYLIAPIYSFAATGGLRHALALVWLGVWYNDWGGADRHPFTRNVINGLGYTCFASGAMEVALGGSLLPLHPFSLLGQWHLVILGVIFSTVQVQDMPDQSGDAKRGRRTAPLVWSDATARWTIALPLLFWGVWCPRFWNVPQRCFVICMSLAWLVAARTLLVRDVDGDKRTFRLWNCWIAMVYMLPLFSERESGQ